ncbi:MAG: SCO family protein [Pseudomonadota bacterium]|nr:SCO family protein [Pseudomonadota bacterium]
MIDDRGRAVTADDFRGAVLMVYFGFTRCPDECPIALARAADAVSRAGAGEREIKTLFVTVDPDADTPTVLHHYLEAFHAAHPIGLWGEHDALLALVKRYRVAYQSADGAPGLPVHGAAMYLFDRAGHARRMINNADSPEAIVHDLRQLLAEPQR